MIQILFGIWLGLLKQSCRKFYGEQFFFLLEPLKRFVKASKVSFKLFRKIISKKRERGQAQLGQPASLSAQPGSVSQFPLPSLPRAAPASLHSAPATWRPYAGVVDAPRPTGLPRSGRHPMPQRAILSPPLLSLFSSSVRESSSSRGGAPPCAIGTAAQLPTPAARARLNPPPAQPRRALPRAHALGRPRQGIR